MAGTAPNAAAGDVVPGSRSVWFTLAVRFGLGAGAAAACAWLSVTVQRTGFAPLGIFSILVGAVLGTTLLGLTRLCPRGGRPGRFLWPAVLGLATAVGQHFVAYGYYRTSYARMRSQDARLAWLEAADARAGPAGFGRFLAARADAGTVLHWTLDAGLIVATTAGVFVFGTRDSAGGSAT